MMDDALDGRAQLDAPANMDLRALLGESYGALETFVRRNRELRPEWKDYGRKLGWSLKLFDGKRNLCFLTPHEGRLMVGFVLGARTTEAALVSALPEVIKQQIRDARVYAEGRGVRLEVRTAADLEVAQQLLELKRSNR